MYVCAANELLNIVGERPTNISPFMVDFFCVRFSFNRSLTFSSVLLDRIDPTSRCSQSLLHWLS